MAGRRNCNSSDNSEALLKMADESLAKIDKFLIEKSANDRPHQSSQSRDKNPSEVSAADSMEILKFKRKNP